MSFGTSISDVAFIYNTVSGLIKNHSRAPGEADNQKKNVDQCIVTFDSINDSLAHGKRTIPSGHAAELRGHVDKGMSDLVKIKQHLDKINPDGKGLMSKVKKHAARVMFKPDQTASLWRDVDRTLRHIEVTCHMAIAEEKRFAKTLNWISPPSNNLDATPRGLENTCTHVLDSPAFLSWESAPGKIMFFHGQPGAGKTTMVSLVVSRLAEKYANRSEIGLACVYLSQQEPRLKSPNDILLAIIRQLCQKRPEILDEISEVRDFRKANRHLAARDTSKVLSRVVSTFSKLFIFIDSIDEIDNSSSHQLIPELSALTSQAGTRSNLFVTSSVHHRLFQADQSHRFCASANDIATYAISRAYSLPPCLLVGGERIRSEDLQNVVEVCSGNFLVAVLLMHEASEVLTRSEFLELLKSVTEPAAETSTTESLIQYIMQKIDKQPKRPRDRAKEVMMWVCFAARPLMSQELCEWFTLASDQIGGEAVDVQLLLSPCRGLVELTNKNRQQTVEFAHRIIGACVHRAWFHDPAPYHAKIAETLFQDLKANPTKRSISDYAGSQWLYHSEKSGSYLEFDKIIDFLLHDDAAARSCWALVPDYPRRSGNLGLALVTHMGLVHYMAALVGRGVDPNTQDTEGETPLIWAIGNQKSEAMAWLLGYGANPNVQAAHGRTALHLAAFQGDREAVRHLLDHGANANLTTDYGETPLHVTVAREFQALCKGQYGYIDQYMRWSKDGPWDIEDHQLEKLLDLVQPWDDGEEYDIMMEHVTGEIAFIVEDLLNAGSDPNAATVDGSRPLHVVHYSGSHSYRQSLAPPIVHALLLVKADPSVRNNLGQTPLMLACFHYIRDSALYLLKAGADVMDVDEQGANALHYAAYGGDLATIRMLLKHSGGKKAELLQSRDAKGCTALHYIQYSVDCYMELLSNGAEADSVNNNGMTPLALHLAKSFFVPCQAIVEILLQRGASVGYISPSGMGLAHLHAAKASGINKDILKLLAVAGLDLKLRDSNGQTVLHHAAIAGSITEAALRYLVEVDLDILNAIDTAGMTALNYATQKAGRRHDGYIFNCKRWRQTQALLEHWPDAVDLETVGRCPESIHYTTDIPRTSFNPYTCRLNEMKGL